MKFRITMKTPDALEDEINHQACSDGSNAPDLVAASAMTTCERWFKYGEMVTLEIDTDSETCTVVPVIEL